VTEKMNETTSGCLNGRLLLKREVERLNERSSTDFLYTWLSQRSAALLLQVLLGQQRHTSFICCGFGPLCILYPYSRHADEHVSQTKPNVPFHCCCRKQVAHKGLCIYTIPNTLILPLKRFYKNPLVSMEPIKLYGRIKYGQKLDLKDFLAPNSPDHPSHSNNVHKPSIAEMRLSGVVIHQGGIGQGHYWAYVQDTCKPETSLLY